MTSKNIRRRRSRRNLGALDFSKVKELATRRVRVGPIGIPYGALALVGAAVAGVGITLLYRMNAARNTEADGTSEDEYDRPDNGPCSKIEEAFNTPIGCGTVGVTGYKKTGWRQAVKQEIQLSELGPYPGFYLQSAPSNAHAAFLRMRAAAKAEAGLDIRLNSAFRTMGKQQKLYKDYLKKGSPTVAYPGTSPHQMGLAVDIQTAGGTLPIYYWLIKNCQRFGFWRTVPSETWHYHYKQETDPFLKR